MSHLDCSTQLPLSPRTPAAARILETAERLFYTRGIGRVGVDAIVAESGVAKATLYVHFRTKDELVAACLADRSRRMREQLEPLPAGTPHPSIASARRSRGAKDCSRRPSGADAHSLTPVRNTRSRVGSCATWSSITAPGYADSSASWPPRPVTPTLRTPPAAWRWVWDAAAVAATFNDPETAAAHATTLAASVLCEPN